MECFVTNTMPWLLLAVGEGLGVLEGVVVGDAVGVPEGLLVGLLSEHVCLTLVLLSPSHLSSDCFLVTTNLEVSPLFCLMKHVATYWDGQWTVGGGGIAAG